MRDMKFGMSPAVGHRFFPGSFGIAISRRFGLHFAIDGIEHGAVPSEDEHQPEVHIVVHTKYPHDIVKEDMADLAADGWRVMDFR